MMHKWAMCCRRHLANHTRSVMMSLVTAALQHLSENVPALYRMVALWVYLY